MKKLLLVLISVLLLTGVAQASEWTQALNAELSAQNKGRNVVTDGSVILKIWSDGVLSYPGVGVSSSSSIIVYTNTRTETGISLNVGSSSFDTIGEIVDYINTNLSTDSTVKLFASVGTDAYRAMTSSQLLAANIVACGNTKAEATKVYSDHSTITSVGIEAVDGVTPRIKNINTQIPAGTNAITLGVYDGDTLVWSKYTGSSAYNSATADAASPNTVVLPDSKGISGTKGGLLCVVATAGGVVDTDTIAKATRRMSIVYDSLRD